jgi:hypothetical protein
MADKPILSEAVAGAPRTGKIFFAIAAPTWTLMIAKSTEGTGGMLKILGAFKGRILSRQT